MLVINIIEDLLLLVASTYIDPLDIEILVINIIENLLLLVASIVTDLISAVVRLLREDINGLVVKEREALELVEP